MLLLLKNNLVYGRLVDGQFKDEVTDENGLKINVKRPPRFVQNDASAFSATLAAQDLVTGSSNVSVNQYAKVHISIGDIEYVQSYNALMQNATMKSAAQTLAHQVDSFIAGQTLKFHSFAEYSATTGVMDAAAADSAKALSLPAHAMAAHTRLMQMGVPDTDICGVMPHADGQLIRGSLTGGFIQGVNKTALERATLPILSTIDWYQTQQTPTLTYGDHSMTAGQIKGASQNVNYRTVKDTNKQDLITDTYGNSKTIKKGEVFTIANVFAWDWRKNAALPYLQQFTVLADVTTDGADGSATLSISPPIIVQGSSDGTDTNANTAFATVDSVPADDAVLTFAGVASTSQQVKAAWQKRAISLVSARLHMPFTGVASFARDPGTGIGLRYWRGSDISTGAHVHRWDMIYGAEVMDTFLGTRVCGASVS
jgi:hypothetical protein